MFKKYMICKVLRFKIFLDINPKKVFLESTSTLYEHLLLNLINLNPSNQMTNIYVVCLHNIFLSHCILSPTLRIPGLYLNWK